jgi:hypothetical protein
MLLTSEPLAFGSSLSIEVDAHTVDFEYVPHDGLSSPQAEYYDDIFDSRGI